MANVYLAVDVQNLETSAEKYGQTVPVAALLDRIRIEGHPVVLRAYADWTEPGIKERMPDYRAYGFELIQLMSDSRGKNTGDIMLALDVMESLHLPDCPDIYVVISGDGDFVPLAPKLRRKLKQFIAMGFRASSNTILQGLCDQFIYLEALIEDFEQKRRAKYSQIAVEEPAAPQETAEQAVDIDAEEKAEVIPAEPAEPVAPEPRAATPQQPQIYDAIIIPEPDFSNVKDTVAYYRTVLKEHRRVRIESFYHRQKLVKRAWDIMEDIGGYVSLQRLCDEMLDYSEYNGFGIYPIGIEVMVRTLFIARCFDIDGEYHGFNLNIRVCPGPGIDSDRALDMMNETYVRGMTMAIPDIHLDIDGLAMLLMDEVNEEMRQKALAIVKKVNPFHGQPTAMGQALAEAGGKIQAEKDLSPISD